MADPRYLDNPENIMIQQHLPLLRSLAIAYLCAFLFGCTKKDNAFTTPPKTVLTGYYSLIGLYSINSNGTYTAIQAPSCLKDFSLNLKENDLMQLQDACLNLSGSWSYLNGILTITEANGTVDMKGSVQFEADGITIDVNSTIDNTRYQLWRN